MVIALNKGQQKVFDGDVFVTHLLCFGCGVQKRFGRLTGQLQLATAHPGQALNDLVQLQLHIGQRGAAFVENVRRNVLVGFQ